MDRLGDRGKRGILGSTTVRSSKTGNVVREGRGERTRVRREKEEKRYETESVEVKIGVTSIIEVMKRGLRIDRKGRWRTSKDGPKGK